MQQESKANSPVVGPEACEILSTQNLAISQPKTSQPQPQRSIKKKMNVNETHVFALHFTNQHFFAYVSANELAPPPPPFAPTPSALALRPGINILSEVLKDLRNYFGFTQFAMRSRVARAFHPHGCVYTKTYQKHDEYARLK